MTNKETLLPIAIKIGPFKNSGDFSITNSYKNLLFLCSVGFCFSLFFFVPVFISCSFNLFFFFCYWQLRSVYLFFRLCHFSLIFVPVFISCLFRGDEWHNYFTSVIDLYNQLLSKISPFRTSGDFSITNSLKFGFSLFCRVLLLAFFRTCFYCVLFIIIF